MRWASKLLPILLAPALLAAPAGIEFEAAGADLDLDRGKGVLHGPLELTYRGVTIEATRRALLTAKGRIVRVGDPGEKDRHRLDSTLTRIVFLGRCRARDASGETIAAGSYLVLDLKRGAIHGPDGVIELEPPGSTGKPRG